jgi:BMFP domain-containing protein YqiC
LIRRIAQDDGNVVFMAEGESPDVNPIETLRREMQVSVEGLHDHIRMVAEAAAGQNEGIVRRLEEMNTVNREEHETFRKVLANHESRIGTLERRAK